ncbi:SURF1 family protein [Streptomyces sp. MNU76]|uniref:SURF1 family protein n=1 Tax=Streptomyces sp. MNU76 TaxID=2560026 RepID=UPI001E51A4E6|nr:SURF1 family protein [Streptomyces sp. MNU76]MCC9707240.1 SURF1 family protein [Streptomyces sp. MNU76]
MYRFLLTPRWWGINVFVLLAIPFCVFMGSWQLSRFEDRMQDHRAATERIDPADRAPARPLESLLPVDKETSGELATVSGRYGEQLLVPNRELDGRTGFYVLTLLRTDEGKALPVVRGWLPGAADADRAPAAPSGEVTVTGSLQASETPGSNGVPVQGGLPTGQTSAISAAALVNLVPDDLYDAWITLDKGDSGMKAVPATAPQDTGLDLKAFQNLGYTGEWFVFAGFVVFMWFRLIRREVEFIRDTELGLLPDTAEPDGNGDGRSAAAPDGDGDGDEQGGGEANRDGAHADRADENSSREAEPAP